MHSTSPRSHSILSPGVQHFPFSVLPPNHHKESVSFFPHKWRFYTNVVPQQETVQCGIEEPFIKLKRINAFLSAKALHVSQLKQFIKGEGFLFKMQVKPNYPTWNLKLFVWDQNWMKQLPQHHVLKCQCMGFVGKEATGKRGRFWSLTSQASTVSSFLGQGSWSATKDLPSRACHDFNFHNKGCEQPFSENLLPAVCCWAF